MDLLMDIVAAPWLGTPAWTWLVFLAIVIALPALAGGGAAAALPRRRTAVQAYNRREAVHVAPPA